MVSNAGDTTHELLARGDIANSEAEVWKALQRELERLQTAGDSKITEKFQGMDVPANISVSATAQTRVRGSFSTAHVICPSYAILDARKKKLLPRDFHTESDKLC